MTEPKVRKDGRCRVCKGERKLTPQRGVPLTAYTLDPFCSSVCARKYFGTLLPPGEGGRQPSAYVTGMTKRRKAPKYG